MYKYTMAVVCPTFVLQFWYYIIHGGGELPRFLLLSHPFALHCTFKRKKRVNLFYLSAADMACIYYPFNAGVYLSFFLGLQFFFY